MRKRIFLVSVLSFALPALSGAESIWSSCQTVTAVTNFTAHSNTVVLALSPGIASCNDGTGKAVFQVGEMGVTADSLKGYLATALSAYLAGKRVMIYYENSTSSCFSSVLSVGGYAGQCP
jgi:hypothetical protein